MLVTVHAFAALRTYFENEFFVELDNSITVGALAEKLSAMNPLAKPVISRCRYAVNEDFVSPEYILNDEQIICLIPPSSGG